MWHCAIPRWKKSKKWTVFILEVLEALPDDLLGPVSRFHPGAPAKYPYLDKISCYIINMSVMISSKNGVVLDHEAWILKMYKDNLTSNVEKSEKGVEIFQQLFDLRTPFLMDGQAEKFAKEMECMKSSSEPQKKKKKITSISDESLVQKHKRFEEISHIMEVLTVLQIMPEFKKFFCYFPSAEDFRSNNRPVRDARKRFMEASDVQLPVPNKGSTGHKQQTLILEDNEYILPPNAEYICDDVRNILSHTSKNKYDLIVMDPPWWNKYIRRRRSASRSDDGYAMLSVADILRIPLKELLTEGGLLVVWCTNNDTQIKELREGLHKWDVDLIATWFWLKLTRGGEPVTPLCMQAHGKLPYERILLARKRGLNGCCRNLHDGRVICSVPSGLHSHKPPLTEILKDYITPRARCMEIFARYLTPGWTSYGLEVLKLQHSFLFYELSPRIPCQDSVKL
ncbi:N(6)-adenine-specific methyltransferase METTL4 isoform X2 [Macrobrachium rosenbergii]|uniref:N(6)-adenine-specific methyltransferase METTL4 isoform X2 n=2 Tax=Macrobrachium rosenbergii TaxID=79674 RepID=UPI0034D6275B